MDNRRSLSAALYTALCALALLALFCLWGVLGRVPRQVAGQGVLVNGGGSVTLYAPADGTVSDLSVQQDMTVLQNDVIARVETAEGEILRVRTPEAGRVASLSIRRNQPVRKGDELGRVLIQSDNADWLAVVCYVPLAEAGAVLPGMEMEVYPVGVETDDTGHMQALVTSRARYPAVEADIAFETGSDAVAESLAENAPVVAVWGALRKDAASQNTYLWSNPGGREVRISDGMLVEAKIVTGYDSPLVLALPALKNLLAGGGA